MENLTNYFDEIYCISLSRRSDRRKKFKKNYKNLGTNKVTFFNAIEGTDIDDPEWTFSKGALGCRLSHLAIYKEALRKKQKRVLIFEDDVIIRKNFIQNLNTLYTMVEDDYDMIYFGGYNYIKPIPLVKNILRLQNTLALHAVAINHRCLTQLIQKIETDKRSIDSVIAELHPQLKVYGFEDQTAIQRKGYSDIMNKKVNYSGSFLGRLYLRIYQIVKNIL